MRNIKTFFRIISSKYLKLLGLVTTSILAIFSVNSCSGIECEYGCPSADFKLNGKIVTESDIPVKSIKVSNIENNKNYIDIKTVFSDENGNYSLDIETGGADDFVFKIRFEDIDGDENGGCFSSLNETINIKKSDFTGAKKWFQGTCTKKIDIKLKEKNS